MPIAAGSALQLDKGNSNMLYMLIAKCYIPKNFPKLYQGKRYNDGIPSMHNNAVY